MLSNKYSKQMPGKQFWQSKSKKTTPAGHTCQNNLKYLSIFFIKLRVGLDFLKFDNSIATILQSFDRCAEGPSKEE